MGVADDTILVRALERMLPGPDETALLRAILHRGDSARRGWDTFRGAERDLPALFRTDTGNRKRLGPLLLLSIRENALTADPAFLTVLKTATLREELRADAYRGIAGTVYGVLQAASVPFLVLRGAQLMETVYADPAHRHAHDIDLLLPPDTLGRAASALEEIGMKEMPSLGWDQGRRFRHSTDLPVLLLRRLHRVAFYRGGWEELAPRRLQWSMEGVGTLHGVDQADGLLLALTNASCEPGRASLVWAVDAWKLIHEGEGIDWDAFVVRCCHMRSELPVGTMLAYLSRELGARVPERIHDELVGSVSDATGMRRDIALLGARQTLHRHPRLARRASAPIRERLTRLGWELFPSWEYLVWAHHDMPRPLRPLLYVTRPVTALVHRLAQRLRTWRTS